MFGLSGKKCWWNMIESARVSERGKEERQRFCTIELRRYGTATISCVRLRTFKKKSGGQCFSHTFAIFDLRIRIIK